jgi:hypothetical protein
MLILSAVITVILYQVQQLYYVAYPLLLLSTLVHEMGHGLTALLVGAQFDQFTMHSDGSGVAHWSGEVGRIARAMISIGGLVGPAVAAAIGFAAGRTEKGARSFLCGLGFFLLLSMALWVRGGFALLFVGVVAAVCLLIAWKASVDIAQAVLLFLSVQLAFSCFSRGSYLFTEYADTAGGRMPSDVAHVAEALFLPYWFWGGVCALISVLVVAWGIRVSWGEEPAGLSAESAEEKLTPEITSVEPPERSDDR